MLAYFLFFSERYGRVVDKEGYRYNLELFKEIKRFITYREIVGFESFVVNILGNILAFAPFGFLLPMLNVSYRKFLRMATLSLWFSIMIEVVQLVTRVGIFDVDDIMMNTFGGIIGYICYMIFHFVVVRMNKSHSKNHRR
jgi:glycopeptide antibiotics resistance protein